MSFFLISVYIHVFFMMSCTSCVFNKYIMERQETDLEPIQ